MASRDVDPKVLRIRMEYAERMHEHYRAEVWKLKDRLRIEVARAQHAEEALATARSELREAECRYLDLMTIVEYVPPSLSPGWGAFFRKIKAKNDVEDG